MANVKEGDRFRSEVDGVPVILEVDEVVMVDQERQEAVLRAHVVRRLEGEE